MVNGRETRTDLAPPVPEQPKLTPQQKCELEGGFWDDINKVCSVNLSPKKDILQPTKGFSASSTAERDRLINESGKTGAELELEEKQKTNVPEIIRDDAGNVTGIIKPNGSTTFGTQEDVTAIARSDLAPKIAPLGTNEAGTAQRAGSQQVVNQSLIGQVGQIDPSTGLPSPGIIPGVSQADALASAVAGSIPSALSLASQAGIGALIIGGAKTGAVLGAAGAPVTGGLSVPAAAAIGAVSGLVVGITRGMLSDNKSQRTDNTNAQQRVLDEGKQTLMDWVTLARADPTNRGFYLSQFNNQLQLIQDAHMQMITDTNGDVAKFETAVPNLAEFNSFYNQGGERDALILEMVGALQTPVSAEYNMLELTNRRGGK